METLEGRALLTLSVTSFPLIGATVQSSPSLVAGPDGNLWFAASTGGPALVGRVTPDGSPSYFSLPPVTNGSLRVDTAGAITTGPDRNLWFTDSVQLLKPNVGTVSEIVRVTPDGGLSEFFLPPSVGGASGITPGPDGNLWFIVATDKDLGGSPTIGRITTAGSVTIFPSPLDARQTSEITDIASGTDGNVWFSAVTSKGPNHFPVIGRITPAGTSTVFPLPVTPLPLSNDARYFYNSQEYNYSVGSLTRGPDGNLWFLESLETTINQIDISSTSSFIGHVGRITATGAIDLFSTGDAPSHIVVGPDEALWFTISSNVVYSAPQGGGVERITTSGQITKINTGDLFTNKIPNSIATGRDGNLWVNATDYSLSEVVRIRPGGSATQTNLRPPAPQSLLTPSGDGNLWFAEIGQLPYVYGQAYRYSAQISRVDVPPPPEVANVRLHPKSVVITFDRPLDPTRAQDVLAYTLRPASVFGVPRGQPIAITSAVYKPSQHAVTLHLNRRIDSRNDFRLTVAGTGPHSLADADGVALDGAKVGTAGTNGSALLHGTGVVKPRLIKGHPGHKS